jgi:cysteine dioxygenase
MQPFRMTLVRCSRSTPPALNLRNRGVDTRGIAGTIIKSSTAVGISHKPQYSTSFTPGKSFSFSRSPGGDLIAFVDYQNHASLPTSQPPLSHTPIKHLLNSLASSLANTPTANLPHLTSLLRSYVSDPAEWSKYAYANPAKQYTRNLVREVHGLFNLLMLVWTPGKMSPVHDHADAHCLMKVLQGDLVETRFAFPRSPGRGGKLTQTAKAQYRQGKVTYMADRLGLHSIANPSMSGYAVSLHCKSMLVFVCEMLTRLKCTRRLMLQ